MQRRSRTAALKAGFVATVSDRALMISGPSFGALYQVGMNPQRIARSRRTPPSEVTTATEFAGQTLKFGVIGIAIITVSDTRTEETDVNAKWLREQINALGHEVTAYRLIKDEPTQVAAVLEELAASPARILLWNGGTGIAPLRSVLLDRIPRAAAARICSR